MHEGLQLPGINSTSKPKLEVRSLVLGRGHNSLTVSRHQIPAFKPLFGALKTEYRSKKFFQTNKGKISIVAESMRDMKIIRAKFLFLPSRDIVAYTCT